ncbi:MAG: PP2C family protein-serine/threonine phosphatase [Defluviitaleaceae bacterium]|nr:PP2C family protein-serine/threonine phosphatase [Defluviitaleaceae bacterium]
MVKQLKTTVITAIVFFAVTMPFREFFSVLVVSEMRPASALPPALGLLFGIPGALGCAVGNLIADIVSGYDLMICLIGFPAQFLYGILPFILWKFINRFDADPAAIRLNNVENVMRYIMIILFNSLTMAGILGVIMQGFGISPLLSTGTLMVFFNNFVFSMVLGIPIIIFVSIQKAKNVNLSLNERLVLILIMISVIKAGLIGVFAYTELYRVIYDPLAMWNRIYLHVAASLSISYLITIVILRWAEKNVTIPIESIAGIVRHYINDETGRADSGSVAAECERFINIRNETGVLAGAFRTMVLDLETYIHNLTRVTAEKERIGAELDVATKIQASMLPCIFPAFPDRREFDLYASMQPAKEVGGDFYDFFLTDENTLAVVMADVSGKGVPAALFMVIAKTLIKNNAQEGKSPAEVFTAVNDMLCENNDADMFVTAFMGYLDIPSGRFTCVNAGHNHPLIKKADGDFEFLKIKPAFVLAGLDGVKYTQHEIFLNPGDMVCLYTDGVTEAENPEQELFSDPLLIEKANFYKDLSVSDFIVKIKEEVKTFANGAEQADDITMLALKITGGK